MLTKTGSRPFARRRAALNRYFTANPNVQQQSKDITRYLLIGSCKTHTMSHSNVMEMQRSLVCTQVLQIMGIVPIRVVRPHSSQVESVPA